MVDWLGVIAMLIGLVLVGIGIGLVLHVPQIIELVREFTGVLAIIVGALLIIGGTMIVKE
jgi:hypothetical protein